MNTNHSMQVGQIYSILGGQENIEYAVRGIDPVSNRIWLCVTELEYDGYSGDLIVSPSECGGYHVDLADNRASVTTVIRLVWQADP